MVELVDTLASGASESNLVGVQVSFRALFLSKINHNIKSVSDLISLMLINRNADVFFCNRMNKT